MSEENTPTEPIEQSIELKVHSKPKTHPTQTIDIDCPPGHPRPGDLIDQVLSGTGLPVREAESRVFGNWQWNYSDIDPEVWKAANPIIKTRLTELYNNGVIRYASW
jgi:hypothetical protein